MKERSWPAWLALAAGVGVAAFAIVAQEPPRAEPLEADPTIFSAARAMKHVEALAKEPHPTGSEAIARVRETIVREVEALGLVAETQTPADPSRPERNILARLKGSGPPGQRAVLLCAHHDSVKAGPGAGDNTSGVAAVLETLRALKISTPLDRDVIALFDDGEEIGLKGAKLFVDEHPWAKDVGVVINIDSRGNRGPSFMFETSLRNGWLIRQFAESTPHPLATSLSMEIYRLMPNDTNLTVFKKAGMDGLNFAFSRGLSYYHTAEDTPANLDPRTLQHQGENVLAMARQFGGPELNQVQGPDLVYFSYLNRGVISYPVTMARPFAYGLVGVYLLTLIIGLVMGRARLVDILAGAVAWPFAAILAIYVVGGFWLVLRDIMGSLGIAPVKFDLPILTCGSVIAAIVTIGVERSAARGRSIESLSLGALGWMVGLAVASSWYLPGASYLFTWPTAFRLARPDVVDDDASRFGRGARGGPGGLSARALAVPAARSRGVRGAESPARWTTHDRRRGFPRHDPAAPRASGRAGQAGGVSGVSCDPRQFLV